MLAEVGGDGGVGADLFPPPARGDPPLRGESVGFWGSGWGW